MTFSLLHTPHPPRRRLSWSLRGVAWFLRRATVLVAVIAVWQRVFIRGTARTGWKLAGTCQSCGRCCENLLLPVESEHRVAAALRKFWHEGVFDFYRKANVLDAGDAQYATYGCHNFTAERTCARYALRPFICRIYPALALYERPRPRAHCGFKVIDD